MLKLVIVIVLACVGALGGHLIVSHSEPPKQPSVPPTATQSSSRPTARQTEPSLVQDVMKAHVAGTQARLDHAAWVMNAKDLARQYGLDPESATFRLLQPASDFGATFRAKSSPSSTLRYDFIGVPRAYTDIIYIAVNGVEWGAQPSVSLQSLFPKTYLSVARSVAGTNNNYNVEIEFSQGGVDRLTALLGTADPSDWYVDWYASPHPGGEAVTEMRAVVTSENVALIPFSVNYVVSQNMVNQPIVVAKDLTQQAASKLVRFLGF